MKPRFAMLKQNFPTHNVSREALQCGGACYWRSGEVWFWPLR